MSGSTSTPPPPVTKEQPLPDENKLHPRQYGQVYLDLFNMLAAGAFYVRGLVVVEITQPMTIMNDKLAGPVIDTGDRPDNKHGEMTVRIAIDGTSGVPPPGITPGIG